MTDKHQLVAADYAIILTMLLVSTVIGFKFRLVQNEQSSTDDYLMAGKNMLLLPVILSISVTLVSGISLIITPTEVYKYDFQMAVSVVGIVIGIVIAAYTFIPVYFRCGVSTIYEFLEMRFGNKIKYIVSTLFILQMVSYTGIVLLPPVLSLSAVTDLSFDLSIIICGSVCTLYCLLGGLKGVLWTDVFQCILMFTFILALYITGIQDSGGIRNVYQRAVTGGKLDVDFSWNMYKRYNFWNAFTSGIMHGFGSYGASQLEVQRAMSLKTEKRAKRALFISSFLVSALYLLVNGLGLVLYAIFFSCDPVFNKDETGISKFEQIIPYYLVNRFSLLPGMTGLCIAGIFSGSLSSVSSVLNSFATVAVKDFVQPLFKSLNITRINLIFVAKGLTLLFGLICTAMPFILMKASSIMQVAVSLHGGLEGPITAVFAAAVLSRKITENCAIVGFLVGIAFNTWITYGNMMSGYTEPAKGLGTNCTFNHTESSLIFEASNLTCSPEDMCLSSPVSETQNEIFFLYKISFMWLRQLGFIVAMVTMFLGVLITGWKKDSIPADSVCLSPVTRLWTPKETKNKGKVQCFTLSHS